MSSTQADLFGARNLHCDGNAVHVFRMHPTKDGPTPAVRWKCGRCGKWADFNSARWYYIGVSHSGKKLPDDWNERITPP